MAKKYISKIKKSGYSIYIKDAEAQSSISVLNASVAGKQDALTFDSTPTANSNNPVKSGGVYTALSGKQATISDLSTIRSGASAGATAYQKPSGGIPKSDMASAVQTSLGKADAAAPQSTTYTKTEVDNLLAGKQATLTFDTAPQAGSTKPVTSNGIYAAIQNAAVTVAYSGDFQGIVGTTNFNNY